MTSQALPAIYKIDGRRYKVIKSNVTIDKVPGHFLLALVDTPKHGEPVTIAKLPSELGTAIGEKAKPASPTPRRTKDYTIDKSLHVAAQRRVDELVKRLGEGVDTRGLGRKPAPVSAPDTSDHWIVGYTVVLLVGVVLGWSLCAITSVMGVW